MLTFLIFVALLTLLVVSDGDAPDTNPPDDKDDADDPARWLHRHCLRRRQLHRHGIGRDL